MDDVRQVIGHNIRNRRKERGWTLVQFGNYLRVSYQQMQKYEKGTNTMPVDKLVAIALKFGCSLDELCGLGSAKFPPEAERLLRRIDRLRSQDQQRRMLDLIEAILAASEEAASHDPTFIGIY